jgi:undecaprenyl-diphosphatase
MPTWVDEAAELTAVVLGLFAALSLVSYRHARWAEGFARRRLAILLCVAALVVLVEMTEEVLGHESTSTDRALLVAVHDGVPAGWIRVFDAATWSGSTHFLIPLVLLVAGGLWFARKRFEALQIVLTTLVASLVVYVAKTAVGRDRPHLWDTRWYWGSSFPSGHTLETAAVATALCLCVARVRPEWRATVVPAAIAWVVMVGLSRLVLGVHWPTDVAAAACAGLLVAAGVNGALATFGSRKEAV